MRPDDMLGFAKKSGKNRIYGSYRMINALLLSDFYFSECFCLTLAFVNIGCKVSGLN